MLAKILRWNSEKQPHSVAANEVSGGDRHFKDTVICSDKVLALRG